MLNFFYYLIFALLPSFIWLFFYLRKDIHPEPKEMILKIFFLGMIAAIPTVFLIKSFSKLLDALNFFPLFLSSIIYIFLITALIEELVKYLIVKIKMTKNKEFDESIDAMIYMIIVGLGFAATENLFIFWSLIKTSLISELLIFSFIRFIGAVFLHTLCSGTIGYFLGLSFFKKDLTLKNKKKLIIIGLLIAIFSHGFYNFFIMSDKGILKFIIPSIILFGLTLFVSWGFKKLKLYEA